jgi:hypothetical protein
MLDELNATLSAVPIEAKASDYVKAIVEDNCLGKRTVSTRRLSSQRLRELYALDPSVSLFRILRRLWAVDTPGRPLFAILVGLARDPLLMATADEVIGLPEGTEYQRNATRAALESTVGERFNESTLDKVLRNTASSWTQSGHLQGRTFKFRRRLQPNTPSLAFAIYMAFAAGFRDKELLSSGWVRVLDCTVSSAQELAMEAKRMGLIDLRIGGNVVEINPERLDPEWRER